MGKAKLERILEDRINANEKIFVPYMMAGDGGLNHLEETIHFLQDCGAAAIEVGIPFSDPVADGPIIQEAGIRALQDGTTLATVIKKLAAFKDNRSIPIVIMTYLNPILAYGVDQFAKDCFEAGVDGVIIPDIPMEEEEIVAGALYDQSIAFIRLAAMTSSEERLIELAKRSEGFLYAVAVKGTTGERESHDMKVHDYLKLLKKNSSIPVLAGFGVSNSEQAQELSEACDGVIVGSKIVQLLHEGKRKNIQQLIKGSIQTNMHKVR
ncbi:tryptophan synthase subunit alpha [Oceanobacillus sp. FSL K6-2867]|uniref:tryptophan synthase subunit alpha n=1 Tax=Oceanobacillus sp. FSL K6-2867 TaxID=2954748 RepID=UPI0030DAA665